VTAAEDLKSSGVLPVLRAQSAHRLVEVVDVLSSTGVTAVELTITTHGALEAVFALRTKHGDAALLGWGQYFRGRLRCALSISVHSFS